MGIREFSLVDITNGDGNLKHKDLRNTDPYGETISSDIQVIADIRASSSEGSTCIFKVRCSKTGKLYAAKLFRLRQAESKEVSAAASTSQWRKSGNHPARNSPFESDCGPDGKLYTAKVDEPGQAANELSMMRTPRLMKFDHPSRKHIIQLIATSTLDSEEADPRNPVTIAFYPWCNGGTLMDLVVDGSEFYQDYMPESFIWHLLDQLVAAVSFLSDEAVFENDKEPQPFEDLRNEQGGPKPLRTLLHGDLKPDNIFLKWRDDDPYRRGYPDVVVGDFGYGYEMSMGEKQVKLFNRPYAPPEAPLLSAKGEVWGAAAIIHALCHRGKPPIVWEVKKKRPRKVRPLPKHFTPELNDVLAWMLEERIDFRPTPQEAHNCIKSIAKDKRRPQFQELPSWACNKTVSEGIDTETTACEEVKLITMMHQGPFSLPHRSKAGNGW